MNRTVKPSNVSERKDGTSHCSLNIPSFPLRAKLEQDRLEHDSEKKPETATSSQTKRRIRKAFPLIEGGYSGISVSFGPRNWTDANHIFKS